jgi:hypothetical protein
MRRLSAGRAALALAVLFVVIQVVVPARTNPPTDPSQSLWAVHPEAVEARAVIDRSCRDCHSNDTVWPWYSGIAPISWVVAHDVNEGRRELNVSTFGSYNDERQARKLQEACDQVKKGEMPMWMYTFQHPDTRLQPGDAEKICSLASPPTIAAR